MLGNEIIKEVTKRAVVILEELQKSTTLLRIKLDLYERMAKKAVLEKITLKALICSLPQAMKGQHVKEGALVADRYFIF